MALAKTYKQKGRPSGESHHRAKLTDHEVELIRQLAAGGMPSRLIAEKMEISRGHVWRLLGLKHRR